MNIIQIQSGKDYLFTSADILEYNFYWQK